MTNWAKKTLHLGCIPKSISEGMIFLLIKQLISELSPAQVHGKNVLRLVPRMYARPPELVAIFT